MIRSLVLLSCLIMAPLAHAASICDDPVTQYDLNMCAHEDFVRADQKLNQSYGKLMNNLSASRQDTLRQGQRAWLLYQEQQCILEASLSEGGSMQPMLYDSCRSEVTQKRTQELNKLDEEFEGFEG